MTNPSGRSHRWASACRHVATALKTATKRSLFASTWLSADRPRGLTLRQVGCGSRAADGRLTGRRTRGRSHGFAARAVLSPWATALGELESLNSMRVPYILARIAART